MYVKEEEEAIFESSKRALRSSQKIRCLTNSSATQFKEPVSNSQSFTDGRFVHRTRINYGITLSSSRFLSIDRRYDTPFFL